MMLLRYFCFFQFCDEVVTLVIIPQGGLAIFGYKPGYESRNYFKISSYYILAISLNQCV
jgi:hypothetical protein